MNTNCLAGMRCPTCKSEGPFRITGTASFLVSDDGTDEGSDIEWDGSSICACGECDTVKTVCDFTTVFGAQSN